MTSASPRPAATARTPFPGRDDFAAGLRQQLSGARKIFVLGIGMGWKSDDRLGTALADALAAKLPPLVEIEQAVL